MALLVVGGNAEMIRTRRAQARDGAASRTGWSSRARAPTRVPLLRASDVLVLPSAYEANALVVLEALACGLPVVSTRVGFAPDLIVDGENGFLVDRDAASVASGSRDLGSGGSRRVARSAHVRTAERHAWPEIARRYLDARRTSLRAEREPHP